MNGLVVSLTSYPARMHYVERVLDSVCVQTILPNRTVLYLAEPQFPEKKICIDIGRYAACGLEIRWCPKNLRPHTKYYYAMKDFPDDCIVTIDDDICYSRTMLEELWRCHGLYPSAVIARRGSKILFKNRNTVSSYNSWYTPYRHESPSMDNFAKGYGGALYPPHLLPGELFDNKTFMSLTPYNDDLWLKVVQLRSGIPVAFADASLDDEVLSSDDAGGLFVSHNRDGGNDRQLEALLEYYGKAALVTAIQKDGFLLESDLPGIFLSWLEQACGDSRFYIFGAGQVARRFRATLVRLGLVDRIICAIVSNTDGNEKVEFDIRVLETVRFEAGSKVVVCVGNKLFPEVKKILLDSGDVPNEAVVCIPPNIKKLITSMYSLD